MNTLTVIRSVKSLIRPQNKILISEILSKRHSGTKSFDFRSTRHVTKDSNEVVKWMLFVIPVTSFGLGCWQTKRLIWKLDLIQRMQAKASAQPIDLPTDFEALEHMEYAPVRVRGKFLHDKEILFGPRSLIEQEASSQRTGGLVSDPNKNQGYLVVTPFQLSNTGDVILVNRGWIPKKLRSKQARESSLLENEIELTGVVRLNEARAPFVPRNIPEKGQWTYRDLYQMSSVLGCQPVWLDVKGIPDPPPGWPIPNQTRVTLRNEHFSYLVTWFSLSAFTSIMWYRRFFMKR